MDGDEVTLESFASELAETDKPDEASQETKATQPETEELLGDQVAGEVAHEESVGAEQPETDSIEDRVVEWETAAGDKFSVPVSELKLGYMREQDYRHKTQEFAKEKNLAVQDIQGRYQAAEQYAQELGALTMQNGYISQLEQAIGQIDRYADPVAYNSTVNDLILARQARDGLAANIAEVQQQRQAEQAQNISALKRQAFAELTSGEGAIPGFGQELITKMNKAGNDYGFSDADLATITDARMIRVLHDAMQYKALQAKKPEAVNKVKQAPIKQAKPTSSKPAAGIEKDIQQLNSKNDLKSFARVLQHTL
ncbi:MAG: hypothetical protein H6R01_438 [Burkholderiaceae bacterium]|nr:hypothetical protein [Burkholderiaceae bacterium]